MSAGTQTRPEPPYRTAGHGVSGRPCCTSSPWPSTRQRTTTVGRSTLLAGVDPRRSTTRHRPGIRRSRTDFARSRTSLARSSRCHTSSRRASIIAIAARPEPAKLFACIGPREAEVRACFSNRGDSRVKKPHVHRALAVVGSANSRQLDAPRLRRDEVFKNHRCSNHANRMVQRQPSCIRAATRRPERQEHQNDRVS